MKLTRRRFLSAGPAAVGAAAAAPNAPAVALHSGSIDPWKIDFDAYIGAYDLHSYTAVFDSMGQGGYTLAEAENA